MEFVDFTDIAHNLDLLITGDPYYTYYWVALLVAGVAFLAFFALEGVALFTIAKRNGFKNKWMAFVPFLNTYYIGVLSEKNRTFGTKTKYVSLALAIVELIGVALGIAYSVAVIQLFATPYIKAVPEPFYNTAGEIVGSLFVGKYEVENLPSSLNWAWWLFNAYNGYFSSIINLVFIVLSVFVLSAFFRTYSPRNYMIFTIFSVLLPIKAIFMICLKNNKATNYVEYMREMQKRQYDAYQQYMRNNGGYNNGGYNNGYGGGYNNGGYGAGQGQAGKPEDPFGGLGEQPENKSNPSDDDPFGDLK